MSQSHLILRQTVRLHLTDPAESWATQRRVEQTLLAPRLLAQLDEVLSGMAGPQAWLEIDRLELSLGQLTPDALEAQLLDRLPAELHRQLHERGVGVPGYLPPTPVGESGLVAWLFFLEHGYLPVYWPRPVILSTLETDLMAWLSGSSDGQRALLRQTLRLAATRARLAEQFSDGAFWAVVRALYPADNQQDDRTSLAAIPAGLRADYRALLLLALTENRPDVVAWLRQIADSDSNTLPHTRSWRQWLRQRIGRESLQTAVADWLRPHVAGSGSHTPADASPAHPPTRPPETTDWPTTPNPTLATIAAGAVFYVQNAGIVLLHPFLVTLFDTCGWWRQQGFRNVRSRAGAVRLLHFLATGERDAPEYDLLLPKLLCGLSPDEPLRPHRLSKRVLAEGMELLEAAIGHWSALKNTSPDGLRDAFLQRDGKLESRPSGGWRLTVEAKPQDALLARLPYGWGLSLIPLPWLPNPLQVEWVY